MTPDIIAALEAAQDRLVGFFERNAWTKYSHPASPFKDIALLARTARSAALTTSPAGQEVKKLGRFGHHPEAAIDYECEIDALIGMAYDRLTGMQDHADLEDRIRKAMEFRTLSTPGELRWLSKQFNGTREIYAVMPECIEKIADRLPALSSVEPAGKILEGLTEAASHMRGEDTGATETRVHVQPAGIGREGNGHD